MQGTLHRDLLQAAEIINGTVYCEQLEWIQIYVQSKEPAVLTRRRGRGSIRWTTASEVDRSEPLM